MQSLQRQNCRPGPRRSSRLGFRLQARVRRRGSSRLRAHRPASLHAAAAPGSERAWRGLLARYDGRKALLGTLANDSPQQTPRRTREPSVLGHWLRTWTRVCHRRVAADALVTPASTRSPPNPPLHTRCPRKEPLASKPARPRRPQPVLTAGPEPPRWSQPIDAH